ncbi:hypothetical protein [Pseudonocardia sp. H11422]|uniref:hypothetical protein n=1 Tax=Pseudonocardia sp. H11422 TaxID=2835866 RepID=UPI001BDC84A0|nr:hypothetical protein [Pseudonocardia sp. H11422]
MVPRPSHAEETIKPPPRCKQWLISLIAAYPLITLTLTMYVVMPVATRLFRRCLFRPTA